MNVYTIKLTLSRSNPQVIRELKIRDNCPVSDLFDCVRCLFDVFPETTVLHLVLENQDIPATHLLNGYLKTGDLATITDTSSAVSHVIHLEVLDLQKEADDKHSVPQITRLRTWQPPKTIRDFRSQATSLDACAQGQIHLNQKLRRQFDPDSLPPELHKEIGIPLSRILDLHTVAELKDFADANDLFYYNGQRKSKLIETLCDDMAEDSFCNTVLAGLSLAEYRTFRHLCMTGALPDHKDYYWVVLPFLSQHYLVGTDYSGTVRVASSFLDFYEQWLGEKHEEPYLIERSYQTILTTACRLYGFVNEELADELMKTCYPDLYGDEITKTLWKTQPGLLKNSLKKLNSSVYFLPEELDRGTAESLNESYELYGRIHYVPDQTALEMISEHGYYFEPDAETELHELLLYKFRCSPYHVSFIMNQLALACYHMIPETAIVNYCADTLSIAKNSSKLKDLTKFLQKYDHKFRRLPYSGFSEEEWQQQLRQSQKITPVRKERIYPNDPCPCGSGKKYKVCCGRKS